MTDSGERPVDIDGFVQAINVARAERHVSWREVARAVNVSASTLTRLRQGATPDLDTFFNLCRWAGVTPERFHVQQEPSNVEAPGPLTAISAVLRSDPNLTRGDAELLEALLLSAYERMTRRD